nr:MAG TPA_asm: hypothetical protein [Caudoviricetes sp.]
MGRELGGAVVDLGDLAIHQMAAAGGGDHGGGGGEILLLRAAVVDVGFVYGDQVQLEAAEVQRTHIDHAIVAAEFLVDGTDDDAAVAVEQLLHLLHVEDRVGCVRAEHQVNRTQAALGQLAAHGLHIAEEVAARGVPLGGHGIGVVAGVIEELDIQLLTLGLVVDVGLHGAGVVDHGLRAHPLLAAHDAAVHVGQVTQLQTGCALGGGAVGVDGLAEAALAQLVQRQQAGRSDERGLKLMDFVAPALHRNITGAGGYERRHLAVALTVLGQHLVRREDVAIAGREVAVLEERLPGHDFFGDRHQDIGIKEIQFCTHGFPSLVGGGSVLEDDTAHTQIVFVGFGDAVAGSDAHLIGVEAAGRVDCNLFVGVAANGNIVAEYAIRRQRFIGRGSGAEDHQLAVASRAVGFCEDRAALERDSRSGLLANGATAYLNGRHDVRKQTVEIHFAEFLAQVRHSLALLLAEQRRNLGSCIGHPRFRGLLRIIVFFIFLSGGRRRANVFSVGFVGIVLEVGQEFLALLCTLLRVGHHQIGGGARLFAILGFAHVGRIEQAGDFVNFLHPFPFGLNRRIDRFGVIDSGPCSSFSLSDFVRVFCPELFQCHRVSSFFAGILRLVFIRLNRGRCLGIDRRNVVRGKHARSEVKLLAAHEQAAPIRAGGDTDRLGIFNQFIREALFNGLTTCHVGCICHHVHDDCFGKPGFALVDLGLHLIPCVLLRGLFP